MDHTDLPTDFLTTEDPSGTPSALEETNQNPNSSHEDDNVSDEVLIQTTHQFPLMTTEPEQQDKITDEMTTAITSLDSAGSGMGDATLSTTTNTINDEIGKPDAYITESNPGKRQKDFSSMKIIIKCLAYIQYQGLILIGQKDYFL